MFFISVSLSSMKEEYQKKYQQTKVSEAGLTTYVHTLDQHQPNEEVGCSKETSWLKI